MTKKKSATVVEIWHHYARHHLPQTRSAWRAKAAWSRLNQAFGKLYPEDISSDHVLHYCDWRMVSNATLNRELAVLAAIISYGRKVGLTAATPYIPRRPPTPAKGRVLSDDEIQKLLAACTGPTLMFVQLALLTGQRREAIIGLQWKQVFWSSRIVDFRDLSAHHQSRMKGRGVVPISGDLEILLNDIIVASPEAMFQADNHLISEWRGDTSLLRHHFITACKRANLTGVTPNTLRHTVATRLVRRGVPLLQVSRLLGHKSVVTTERNYLSLSPDYIADAAMQLSLD